MDARDIFSLAVHDKEHTAVEIEPRAHGYEPLVEIHLY
jgi:hypothetical protein